MNRKKQIHCVSFVIYKTTITILKILFSKISHGLMYLSCPTTNRQYQCPEKYLENRILEFYVAVELSNNFIGQ